MDFDGVNEMVLATTEDRRQADQGPDGRRPQLFFYVIDRTNGKLIAANPYVKVTSASSIDMATGEPVDAEVTVRARRRRGDRNSSQSSAARWEPMSFDQKTARLRRHAELRRQRRGGTGGREGRRSFFGIGSFEALGLPEGLAAIEGNRCDARQSRMGSAQRHSALFGRAVDRGRHHVHRPAYRRSKRSTPTTAEDCGISRPARY